MLSATPSHTNITTDENAVPSQHAVQHSGKHVPAEKLSVKQMEKLEPILMDNPGRFVLFPVKYNDVNCLMF